jgi:hypothetical protein
MEIKSFNDLEIFVQEQVESHAGSISVAVLQGDEIVYSFGSMTKLVTATALMQLVEEGRLNMSPERQNVTVRQLLDHSACMGTA